MLNQTPFSSPYGVYTKRTSDEEVDRHRVCELQTIQCQYVRPSGVQCKRKITIGLPFCGQHTEMVLNLKVVPVAAPSASAMHFLKKNGEPRVTGNIEYRVYASHSYPELLPNPGLVFPQNTIVVSNEQADIKKFVAAAENQPMYQVENVFKPFKPKYSDPSQQDDFRGNIIPTSPYDMRNPYGQTPADKFYQDQTCFRSLISLIPVASSPEEKQKKANVAFLKGGLGIFATRNIYLGEELCLKDAGDTFRTIQPGHVHATETVDGNDQWLFQDGRMNAFHTRFTPRAMSRNTDVAPFSNASVSETEISKIYDFLKANDSEFQ